MMSSKTRLFFSLSTWLLLLLLCSMMELVSFIYAQIEGDNNKVRVVTISPGDGDVVTRDHRYSSMVTLYIEESNQSKTPSGWSTRVSDGASVDSPFDFQPGVGCMFPPNWDMETGPWEVRVAPFIFLQIRIFCLILKYWAKQVKQNFSLQVFWVDTVGA
jgi:hypothetical protein